MVLHSPGDSIECSRCEVKTRKVVPSAPQIVENPGYVIKYDCSRNCSTENIEELSPKQFLYKETSDLDLGTILRADSIYILTTSLRKLTFRIIPNSGRHKAAKGLIKGFIFAEIKYPLQNVINSIEKRKAIEK